MAKENEKYGRYFRANEAVLNIVSEQDNEGTTLRCKRRKSVPVNVDFH